MSKHEQQARLQWKAICWAALVTFGHGALSAVAQTEPNTLVRPDFQRDILPLLSDRCFVCHGPDEATNDSGLRLDLRGAAIDELPDGGGHAIVPGPPQQSAMIQRVTTSDQDSRMPPAGSGRRSLNGDEVDRLRIWIADGAPYGRHWSFQPLPVQIAVPLHDSSRWPRNETINH